MTLARNTVDVQTAIAITGTGRGLERALTSTRDLLLEHWAVVEAIAERLWKVPGHRVSSDDLRRIWNVEAVGD